MKLTSLIHSAFALHAAEAYLVAPPGTPAPGATQECSDWVQQSYGLTCAIIEKFYGMTEVQFQAWNPSTAQLGSGCNLIQGLYYCVQVNYKSSSFLSTSQPTTLTRLPTVTTSPTITEPSTTIPSSTGNSVATPTPTQTGMVSNCNKFYLVVSGDGCYDIAATYGISLDNFYAWNPAVGDSCGSLWPNYYVCVGISTASPTTTPPPTTTDPGNGVTTPTPTQADMTGDCKVFHLVVSGDTCYDISATSGISLSDFYAWNPSVGSSCDALLLGFYVCIAVL
ncbi:LysM domain-containing protein [Massarina eburnea CBS 473.64]|uniref:LysM domain-containing protein n=1 Tax=Massarina eburnea CBS 473.64 TaxID=1395130 RepID=A0A6A6RGQ3_9PLEO|nr:LysM domain-containing protein [Massarina eburnea CBS 473.64]